MAVILNVHHQELSALKVSTARLAGIQQCTRPAGFGSPSLKAMNWVKESPMGRGRSGDVRAAADLRSGLVSSFFWGGGGGFQYSTAPVNIQPVVTC